MSINKVTDWRTWLRGIVGGVVGGGANAVTVMVVEPKSFNFDTGWPALWHFTAISALVSAALYLRQNPVPPQIEETAPDSNQPESK